MNPTVRKTYFLTIFTKICEKVTLNEYDGNSKIFSKFSISFGVLQSYLGLVEVKKVPCPAAHLRAPFCLGTFSRFTII